MKKVFTLFFMLCIGIQVQAQTYIGLKAGLNLSTATAAIDADYVRTGFHGGAFQEYHFGKSWAIRGELLYSQKGWNTRLFLPNYGLIDLRFRLNYVDGVIALHWKVLPKLAVYPGVQLSALVQQEILIHPIQTQIAYRDPSRFEFAPIIGVNFKFSSHWGTDLRFTYSTWSVDGYPAAKSAVGMLSLEYTL